MMQPALPLTAADTHGILLRSENRILASSDRLRWANLYASRQVESPYRDCFAARQNHLLVLHLSGPVSIERELAGSRSRAKVHAGGMFLLPGGCDFGVEVSGRLETLHLYIRDTLFHAAAAELCKGDPEKFEVIPRLGERDPVIEQLGRVCCSMLSDGQSDFFADGVARLIAAQLVRAHSNLPGAPEPKTTGLSARQLAKVEQLIEERLEESLSIDDLASAVGLNAIHFARQFKKTTGQPPYQFVIERRVERARALLATDMPIAEIAVAAGFTHQEHLTRLFGRQTGVTPAAYRRQIC